LKKLSTQLLLSIVSLWALATAAQAHDAARPLSSHAPLHESAPVAVNGELAPVAARYVVTIARAASGTSRVKPQQHTWYFYRDAQRVALLKGAVDEVWFRDAQQRVSFERVFHDDERVVDYSTGELATLNVKVDWAALSTFVDPSELAQLKRVSTQGKGKDTRWHLRGRVGQELVTVDWLLALQLPQRLTRQVKGGTTVRMVMVESASSPLPNWPGVGAKSAQYLHLDAADFGDMDYDPVVRKSEALDTRLGWRASHKHD
jgi:hypothetical protein